MGYRARFATAAMIGLTLAVGSAFVAPAAQASARATPATQAVMHGAEEGEAGPDPRPYVPTSATADEVAAIEQFMTAVLTDVDEFWNAQLNPAGYQIDAIYEWLDPSEAGLATGCGPIDDVLYTAAYCPADDLIIMSDLFGLGMARTFGPVSTAIVLAHEYAHNVQNDVLGSGEGHAVADWELQADCLAGHWALDAYHRGLLSAEEVQAARTFVHWTGDDDFDSPGHHGTPDQRVGAFDHGYTGNWCPTSGLR